MVLLHGQMGVSPITCVKCGVINWTLETTECASVVLYMNEVIPYMG